MTQPPTVSTLRLADPDTVRTVAYWIIAIAGSWWLLDQLQSVLRPLLLAAFLAYVLLPYYSRLRKKWPAPVVLGLLATLTAAGLAGLVLSIYASLLGLGEELPQIQQKLEAATVWLNAQLRQLGDRLQTSRLKSVLPISLDFLPREDGSTTMTSWLPSVAEPLSSLIRSAANSAAGGLVEAAATGLYLLFLLLGAERFPHRVRQAYPPEQAESILQIAGRINSAIISYLKAKVKSSLVIAVPAGLLLWIFGVKFALLWVVLTFLCNFIPYIGSIIAYSLPVAFALVQLGFGWNWASFSLILLSLHLASAMLFEPMIIGKAIGVSPLLILAALSIWGTLWGLPGMFLAVPLTVVLKIIFANIEATRSVVRLLDDD